MSYDTIFFDIGNTLFFFNYEFLRDLLKQRFDVDATVLDLETKHVMSKLSLIEDGSITSLSHDELWFEAYRRWLAGIGVEKELIAPITKSIQEHPFKHLFWARMHDGTREMLDWFRERGYRLGVISNAEGQVKRLLEHVGLEDRFEVIVDSQIVGFNKPDERIFKYAMNSIGARPEKSIHVGDILEIDVVGAKGAGITPILVDSDGVHGTSGCITVPRAVELPNLPLFSNG